MVETKVSSYEIKNYYQNNLNSFKLNEDVIQIRYIILPKDNIDLELIQESFKNFTEDDITFLNSLSCNSAITNLMTVYGSPDAVLTRSF